LKITPASALAVRRDDFLSWSRERLAASRHTPARADAASFGHERERHRVRNASFALVSDPTPDEAAVTGRG
jgi:hypothetical protein